MCFFLLELEHGSAARESRCDRKMCVFLLKHQQASAAREAGAIGRCAFSYCNLQISGQHCNTNCTKMLCDLSLYTLTDPTSRATAACKAASKTVSLRGTRMHIAPKEMSLAETSELTSHAAAACRAAPKTVSS